MCKRRISDALRVKPSAANKCKEAGCDRRARFAFKGSKSPVYCTKHR